MERTLLAATVCLLKGGNYENVEFVLNILNDIPVSADLSVLPHMPFLEVRPGTIKEDLKVFAAYAENKKTYLALSVTEYESTKKYNTAILIDRNGDMVGKYRKSHKVFEDVMDIGDDIPIFDTEIGKLGLTIGTDFYFPEIYEVLKMKGADIITWHNYPDRFREHSSWEPLLAARCIDSRCHMVTAMYADEKTYMPNRYKEGWPGSPWGRSMILNRVGVPLADTGYAEGCAFAKINPDKRKKNVFPDDPRDENIFIVSSYGDRKSLEPITKRYGELNAPKPAYKKRQCRIAIATHFPEEEMKNDKITDAIEKIFEDAATVKPDLLLFTEQGCRVVNETTDSMLLEIGKRAKSLNSYVAMGGITNIGCTSVCHLWDRDGKLVYAQPIFWPFEDYVDFKVYDTDFGRIGAHTCGDLWTPLIDRIMALKGAEIIIDPSHMCGPDGRWNETMLRARAIDSCAWLVVSHSNSSDPSLRSLIIDPAGQVVSASAFNRSGINYYDLDLETEQFYYEDIAEVQREKGELGMNAYFEGNLPCQKKGRRDILFNSRRPELYEIIPTTNDVIDRGRGVAGHIKTVEKKSKILNRPDLNIEMKGM